MKQNQLVGKSITEIQIASDRKAIRFILADGSSVIAKIDGECCSNSWIESIELPALGFPALVASVDDLDMPDLGDMDSCDVVSYYGLKIDTDRGSIVIDYRNDSNGYYGGNIVWPWDGCFYGGVFGQNVSSEQWGPVS